MANARRVRIMIIQARRLRKTRKKKWHDEWSSRYQTLMYYSTMEAYQISKGSNKRCLKVIRLQLDRLQSPQRQGRNFVMSRDVNKCTRILNIHWRMFTDAYYATPLWPQCQQDGATESIGGRAHKRLPLEWQSTSCSWGMCSINFRRDELSAELRENRMQHARQG